MKKPKPISKTILSVCALIASFGAAPLANATRITSPNYGPFGDYYYSAYKTSPGSFYLDLGVSPTLPGYFAAGWTNVQNIVVGYGWNPGNYTGTINYNCGNFTSTGAISSTLGVYGWTFGPTGIKYVSEYYIVDTWTGSRPTGDGRNFGTIYVDGAYYDIYKNLRKNAPSRAGGSRDFWQYYSVRQTKRALKDSKGNSLNRTVTLQPHFSSWANIGMAWNRFDYQLMAVEAQDFDGTTATASGSLNMTVW
jgi:endo-1,4-beta-xylanase